ncbi:MAG TPA: hypothetical protein PK796_10290 [Bacteroidales bacterium]|jgi:hypothetical protein|nr:hypothetical protein [Bacteroidales bacterium]
MSKSLRFRLLIPGILLLTIYSCKTYYFREDYKDANSLIHSSGSLTEKPYLKAHMKNGCVYILKDTWQVDSSEKKVSGTGSFYDFSRQLVSEGEFTIPADSVAIFETNTKLLNPEKGYIAALSILAGVEVILGVICVTVPKACWGSCPTFYLDERSNLHYADAEVFTNAISPSMEYTDVDALGSHLIPDHSFSVTMKNEALETHCVSDVKLLACQIGNDERVYQSTTGSFFLCGEDRGLLTASGTEGDITSLLMNDDKVERFSLSDENNLNSRESIYLTFDNVQDLNNTGLVLHYRQTLMNTYLFYNALGYMGDMAGDVFAMMETREDIRNNFDAISRTLGKIDIYAWNADSSNWKYEGSFSETGPIAINRQLIPLKFLHQSNNELRIKLVLNKGLWRLDYAALTGIKEEIDPIELRPVSILNKGKPDEKAMKTLGSRGEHLVSMPGSEYKFNFALPGDECKYELFLSARGYYLEWMRDYWLKDKNLLKLKQMLYNPEKYLKREAGNYKHYESVMEELFWNSRIDTKNFTYYEK